MKYRLIYTLFILFPLLAPAQNFGFFGHKNMFDFNLLSSYPLIYNWTDGNQLSRYRFGEDEVGEYYTHEKSYVDLAYNVSYFRSIKKGLSLGLEYEYRSLRIGAPNVYEKEPYSYYSYGGQVYADHIEYYGQLEQLHVSYQHIIPKVEFSNPEAVFGMGVNHQIGFGVATATLKKRDYEFNLRKQEGDLFNLYLTGNEKAEFRSNFYDFENNKYRFYLLTYAISLRKPISKNLMLSYGFKYNFTYMKGFRDRFTEETDFAYWMSHREAGNRIYPKVMTNILQLKLGVSFLF